MPKEPDFLIAVIGWSGAVLILASYILLSMGKLSGQSRTYQWMNVAGATAFIINSGWNGAYPSAALNVAWITMGIYALWRIERSRRER
jgi:hypothetical protein